MRRAAENGASGLRRGGGTAFPGPTEATEGGMETGPVWDILFGLVRPSRIPAATDAVMHRRHRIIGADEAENPLCQEAIPWNGMGEPVRIANPEGSIGRHLGGAHWRMPVAIPQP